MITFETQKDFEAAVMAVLSHRLRSKVYVHNSDDLHPIKVEVSLMDEEATEGCISFDWDEE